MIEAHEMLLKQVETASLKIALRTEVDRQVFAIAARDGLDRLANDADAMLGFIFQLPAIALWIATLLSVGL